jgi:hypothetical protein
MGAMTARLLSILAMLAAAALCSCGGTSSETPWPTEPQGAALGPAGESRDRAETELPSEVTNESESPDPASPAGDGAPDGGAARKKP